MYNLFISHSWTYSDQYARLVNLLNAAPYFEYRNYSVPKNDPIHNAQNSAQLREAIRLQMQYSSVVIVLAGVYATYSKWINIELDLARSGFTRPKPVLAIEPFGSERTSLQVKSVAAKIVKWNTASIVTAIRELG